MCCCCSSITWLGQSSPWTVQADSAELIISTKGTQIQALWGHFRLTKVNIWRDESVVIPLSLQSPQLAPHSHSESWESPIRIALCAALNAGKTRLQNCVLSLHKYKRDSLHIRRAMIKDVKLEYHTPLLCLHVIKKCGFVSSYYICNLLYFIVVSLWT